MLILGIRDWNYVEEWGFADVYSNGTHSELRYCVLAVDHGSAEVYWDVNRATDDATRVESLQRFDVGHQRISDGPFSSELARDYPARSFHWRNPA